MNADSWKQRMAHSLVWVSSALTSLTIAIPHTVTALLKTQSHSNISLTKYAILFSANREGWAHIKPILFAPISMRGEFHNCLTAPVHCSNPVLTSKTFFFKITDLIFYVDLLCWWTEKRWVWNMQQRENVENSSLLSILVYPHDWMYNFWSYLWLWTMQETMRVHHLSRYKKCLFVHSLMISYTLLYSCHEVFCSLKDLDMEMLWLPLQPK